VSQARAIDRRKVAGIVLVDKPSGLTSNRVLQTLKRLFAAEKAGHTGSLDPLATGMLPICLGSATKVAGLLLDARKSYRVWVRLGAATDTGDADGKVVAESPAPPHSREDILGVLARFIGPIDQVPPMYSALKHQGRRLYSLARRGEEVVRQARSITIHSLELESIEWPTLCFRVECSKGTYVRSLVTDIARELGTLGYVTALRRLAVGPYSETEMHGIDRLEALAAEGFKRLDTVLLSADTALAGWPMIVLDAEQARRLSQGQRVSTDAGWPAGRVRLYGPEHVFLGVGNVLASGELKSQRLFLPERLGDNPS
jgi:tRNA pseudouridine55 synthase